MLTVLGYLATASTEAGSAGVWKVDPSLVLLTVGDGKVIVVWPGGSSGWTCPLVFFTLSCCGDRE